MGEIIVVGYGSKKKSDVTGAVASVPKERLSNIPVTNALQAIQGSVAGVNIIQSSSVPGTDEIGFSTYKDLIMMRLGETYLLLAEAHFIQSEFDDAATSINELRDRAGATPVDPGDVTLDLILDERARELLAEENRRMTLVRTGKLVDRVHTLNPGPYPGTGGGTTGITADNMLLPISQSEMDLNKDTYLGQNLGY